MRALSLIVFVSALAGCERVAADRADAQLVARVNGIEISARQVRSGGAPSVAQAVEKIIEPQLLVENALEAGPVRGALVEGGTSQARPPQPRPGFTADTAVRADASPREIR